VVAAVGRWSVPMPALYPPTSGLFYDCPAPPVPAPIVRNAEPPPESPLGLRCLRDLQLTPRDKSPMRWHPPVHPEHRREDRPELAANDSELHPAGPADE